jgi:hypothetical protein
MGRPLTEASEYKQITVRLPKELLAELKHYAASIRRPMNTEIIVLLEDGVRRKRQRTKDRRGLTTATV